MEILIKNQSIINVLSDIGEAFRALCPDDYDSFIKYVKDEKTKLIKPSGMSTEGHFMNFMKLPCGTNSKGERINLYSFIKQQMRKRCGIEDFFADRHNYYLLCQVWSDAHVKTVHKAPA